MGNFFDDVSLPADGDFSLEAEGLNTDMEAEVSQSEQDASLLFSTVPPEVMATVRSELRGRVNDIPVEIEVVIGRAKISVAELMRADPGHSFRLDKSFGEPVELLANGRLIGHGEIIADRHDNVIGVRMLRVAV